MGAFVGWGRLGWAQIRKEFGRVKETIESFIHASLLLPLWVTCPTPGWPGESPSDSLGSEHLQGWGNSREWRVLTILQNSGTWSLLAGSPRAESGSRTDFVGSG